MDTVTLFGRSISLYGLMGIAGILSGMLYLTIYCKVKKESFDDSIYVYVWACIGAMIGAKILYLCLEAGNIAKLIADNPDKTGAVISVYITGGFVFYGGLLGAVLGIVCISRYFSLSSKKQLNILTPAMPLVHGMGRIGCHLVGCCYGINYDGPLAKVYLQSKYAPNGTGLFPVQLCEACLDFILFTIFVVLIIKNKATNHFFIIYLSVYSIGRFMLEFFRGDAYRGIALGLSTSQYISIAVWLLIAFYIANELRCRS